MGREENRVTGSHKWELDVDVTSLGTSPMKLALYSICGALNVCLEFFTKVLQTLG